MVKQKFRFIYNTNGTSRWPNLNNQKNLQLQEFVIRVNMDHYR